MKVSDENVKKAERALRHIPPLNGRELPYLLDQIYHSIVGMREARRARWEPELMAFWDRTLATALEKWRVTREAIDQGEEQ